ncbi:MAG: glycerophosphodiester phosphodiesterase [Thermoanaerobaculia bacterium]|nr:glycerophosphodiester phosphodiesterase [Thermoanaerobaculia bacterium]
MLLLGHRGYHQSHPENTLEAFAAALALGVDGIETDVRLSTDGLPILFHDRLAPSGTPVAELTRAQLEAETGHPIPTLDEALAAWAEPLWNLEVKTPAAVPVTIDVLRRFTRSHRLLVTSFCHLVLAEVADALGIECGALCAHAPADPAAFLRSLRVLHPRLTTTVWPFEPLSETLIDAARAAQLRLFVYDVETAAELALCRALAVDGVILDRPELGRPG